MSLELGFEEPVQPIGPQPIYASFGSCRFFFAGCSRYPVTVGDARHARGGVRSPGRLLSLNLRVVLTCANLPSRTAFIWHDV